ncbi:MAG TPA: alpha/beta fold hydrolase [Actinomycetota bacterium]
MTPEVRPGAEPFSFPGGPVGVLMIHGFTGSPASMRPIGEWLAGNGLSVEGVRLPGHGTDVEDLRTRRWTEWVDEAARGLETLTARCRTVVAFGQSMGASVALALAASRPADVDGLALANPYVSDARHAVIPLGRLVLRDVRGVANDIALPGVDENADERMPVAAVAEMAAMLRVVRSALPTIRQPVVVFRSGVDHVIPRSNARKLLDRIGSQRTELVACPRSFHVVTLDHDAPLVRERVLAFARELDGAKGP